MSAANRPARKIHWKLLPPAKEKVYVFPSAGADAAKQELRTFVSFHQLRYKPRRDLVADFDDFAVQLNTDADLIDRAERRDLHSSLFTNTTLLSKHRPVDRDTSPRPARTIPVKRSALPNIVHDDYARRRYSLHKASQSSRPPQSLGLSKTISYISLESFDDFRCKHDANNSYCDHCSHSHASQEWNECEPDIVIDDMLNRRIRQSAGANVLPVHPQFGIPNSRFMHTTPESDYSRVQPIPSELCRPRYSYREQSPDVIHDDLAFRTLRKDYRGESRESIHGFAGIIDDTHVPFSQLRSRLKPIKCSSLTDSFSSCSSFANDDSSSLT